MFKMIAIYKVPADVSAFNDWYKGHTEIAKKVPLVKEFRFSKITGGPRGASELHLVAELCFATKEDFKTVNLSRHYFNPSEETQEKFNSAIAEMDEILDVNGKKIDKSKIFSSGKLIGKSHLVRGVNGNTLKIIDKDGVEVSIPFDMNKLGSTTLRNYDAEIRQIQANMKSKSDKWLRDFYGDPQKEIDKYEDAMDAILTSEQYTETKSQDTNPRYRQYGK